MFQFERSLGKIGELQVMREESESGYSCLEWRIHDFLSLPADDHKYYRSDSFQALGESWHLRVYPNKAFILSAIVKEKTPRECRVQCSLSLKKACDTLPNEFVGGTYYIFGADQNEFPKLVYNRLELECHTSELVPTGVLTLVCFLRRAVPQPLASSSQDVELPASSKTMEKTPDLVEASTHEQTKLCSEKLSHDLSELMLSRDLSDFIVQVKEEEFHLHRTILSARSPVFQSMFKHDMTETQTGRVSLDDCEPDEFRAFVRYVYTGRTDQLHADIVFGVFALADKYQTEELKSSCLTFIRSTLSVETLCDVVQFALTYDDRELLEQAVNLLSEKTNEVIKTVKWMDFLKANHIQANEIMLKALERKQH